MGDPVAKGQFIDVEVARLQKLEEPKGSCFGFADIVIHGIKIRNLTIFKNQKDGKLFVKPPAVRGSNDKYYPVVNFGKASSSISEAVLKQFKS